MKTIGGRVTYVVGAGVVIIFCVSLLLSALRFEPGRQPGINSDALGPENGESIEDYVSAAAQTIEGSGEGDDGPRWALIALDSSVTAADASRVAEPLERVSRVIVQSPREGLAMPVMWKDVAEPVSGPFSQVRDREEVFDDMLDRLADGTESMVAEGMQSRSSRLAALCVEDMREGKPTIIGLVARSELSDLREVAGSDGVRAVEALPADAIWGRFAVRPLLPQQEDVVAPLPDYESVPEG